MNSTAVWTDMTDVAENATSQGTTDLATTHASSLGTTDVATTYASHQNSTSKSLSDELNLLGSKIDVVNIVVTVSAFFVGVLIVLQMAQLFSTIRKRKKNKKAEVPTAVVSVETKSKKISSKCKSPGPPSKRSKDREHRCDSSYNNPSKRLTVDIDIGGEAEKEKMEKQMEQPTVVNMEIVAPPPYEDQSSQQSSSKQPTTGKRIAPVPPLPAAPTSVPASNLIDSSLKTAVSSSRINTPLTIPTNTAVEKK